MRAPGRLWRALWGGGWGGPLGIPYPVVCPTCSSLVVRGVPWALRLGVASAPWWLWMLRSAAQAAPSLPGHGIAGRRA